MKSRLYYIRVLFLVLMPVVQQCQHTDGGGKASPTDSTRAAAPASKPGASEPVRDDRGNIVERHGYTYKKTDSTIRSQESYYYTYNETNLVVEEVKESSDPEGNLLYRNINQYRYNDQNRITDVFFKSFGKNGALNRSTHHNFRYNSRGYKIEDTGFGPDGGITSRIIMEPDTNGNLLSEEFIQYDLQGSIKEHKKFYYSGQGLKKTIDLMKEQ